MNATQNHGPSPARLSLEGFAGFLRPVMAVCLLLLAILACGALTGCASSPRQMSNPLPVHTQEYDAIYQASVDILRENGFRLDRQDHRFGVVTTYPRVSPTFGEPWYSDNTTPNQALTSTTNYQRRRVNIHLLPAATESHQGDYELVVEVFIEQIETPRRFLTGSTSSGRIFRDLRAAPAELAAKNISENYWHVVSQDIEMEQRLLADIIRKSVVIASNLPSPKVVPAVTDMP